jgi:MFS family permease
MRAPRRPGWLTTPILAVSGLSIGSGLAQFGVTAVIGDVAAAFGEVGDGGDLTAQIGLPATTVGLALALIRLTSLAALPVSSVADRVGRQRVLVAMSVVGLGLTTFAALAPGFWWYVTLVALARPALSGVNAVAGVVASEETRAKDRSAAIALVTAAYGVGAGLIVVGRAALGDVATFRIVTAAAVRPAARCCRSSCAAHGSRASRAATSARAGCSVRSPAPYVRSVALLSALSGLDRARHRTGVLVPVRLRRTRARHVLRTARAARRARRPGRPRRHPARTGGGGPHRPQPRRRRVDGWDRRRGRLGVRRDDTRLAVGYLLAILSSSAFAPPTGALGAELVPTRIRATLAGWITFAGVLGAVIGIAGFGVLADATGGFDRAARTIGIVTALTSAGLPAAARDARGRARGPRGGRDADDCRRGLTDRRRQARRFGGASSSPSVAVTHATRSSGRGRGSGTVSTVTRPVLRIRDAAAGGGPAPTPRGPPAGRAAGRRARRRPPRCPSGRAAP